MNHKHHPDELYRHALTRWLQRRANLINLWRTEELRIQYAEHIGTIYDDITAILDSPHGPPILETLLAEHDAETDWEPQHIPLDDAA